MKFDILTLFPEMFDRFIETSIIGRAVNRGEIEVICTDIRAFSKDKHRKVDDYPFGGGAGMVMAVQPLRDALLSKAREANSRVVYMSPRGETLTQNKALELSKYDELILVCGHYEGVDQRFIDTYVDEELSIGDYVLTGGELAAMVTVDCVSRMVGTVLQNSASGEEESFSNGLLEYPHYTRPQSCDEGEVPPILLSGNHAKIDEWRLEQSLQLTAERRPELYKAFVMRDHDKKTQKIIKKTLNNQT